MIFLTICPMLVYETNIEVSFKTSPCLNPKDTFHKLSEERVKIFSLSTFDIISYIFLENFIEIHISKKI